MSAPIIITVPNNYMTLENGESQVAVEAASPAPSRKRRLDHLTWEEKMQRKKLKNRVAAQTSRDRKKAKMDEMENSIKQLADANDRLSNEMTSLRALNERLLSENTKLRSELAAARTVAAAPGPAEGGGPDGDPRGAPAAGHVSPISDLIAHLDSEEYLDTLHQLADSLLKEIDAGSTEAVKDNSSRISGDCSKGTEVVGTATEQLEPCKGGIIDLKHDINRILSQHSYAHPYTPDIVVTEPECEMPEAETSEISVEIKEEDNGNDKGDIFYESFDEANDCITIEVPCEDQEDVKPFEFESEFNTLTDSATEIMFDSEMKLLSPMSLSPKSEVESTFSVSPSHTSFSSDLGYESLASPLSDPDSLDLPDFWCESFSELFPGLT